MKAKTSVDPQKQEKLKSVIKDLHAGKELKTVKKKFAGLIKNVSPEEIAAMENALINEGFPPQQIQELCEVHISVFNSALKKHKNPKNMPGHPVHTYCEENKVAGKLLKTVTALLKRIEKTGDHGLSRLNSHLAELNQIELHFLRKENQLFPKLEAAGFTGPSRVMWGKHDEIRNRFKLTEEALRRRNYKQAKKTGKELIDKIKKMIFMEEKILFPASLRKLTKADWIAIRKEEPEIGYAWIKPGNLWDTTVAAISREKPPAPKKREPKSSPALFHLDQGELGIHKINLLLKNLPLDITYVDQNDKVAYYSQGKDRIFPRSPAVIGRAVQNCHPPQSVHIVNKIISAFRNKEKDTAEFWIKINNRVIHIRYFALYGPRGQYEGVLEMTQDITDMQKLSGERRLLDWD